MDTPIVGELSIDLGDEVTLSAATDVELARKWAAYLHGRNQWECMSFGQQSVETANALQALREAFKEAEL